MSAVGSDSADEEEDEDEDDEVEVDVDVDVDVVAGFVVGEGEAAVGADGAGADDFGGVAEVAGGEEARATT
jgi:hypothetical protein